MLRTVILIAGGLAITFIMTIVGLLVGMTIGGNFFVDFEFLGGRGYEAMGTLGSIVGFVLGVVLTIFIILRYRNRSPIVEE